MAGQTEIGLSLSKTENDNTKFSKKEFPWISEFKFFYRPLSRVVVAFFFLSK
jgi:hypothetical protein